MLKWFLLHDFNVIKTNKEKVVVRFNNTIKDLSMILQFYHYLTFLCRYWCLKEAYIKAIGAGLGYRLDRLEFHHSDWTDISVHVDGEESREWRFWLFDLGKSHWVSALFI